MAADGAASLIRSELGIELEGSKELSHIVNCYFRADIEPHLGERKGVLFFVSNEHASGVLQPLDGAGRWLCQISVQPEEWSLDVFTHERARAWIRAAVGVEGGSSPRYCRSGCGSSTPPSPNGSCRAECCCVVTPLTSSRRPAASA